MLRGGLLTTQFPDSPSPRKLNAAHPNTLSPLSIPRFTHALERRDDSFDAALEHWAPKNDEYDHPFDVADNRPPTTAFAPESSVFDIHSINMAEIEAWQLASQTEDQPHADESYCGLPPGTPISTATLADFQVLEEVGQHGGAPEQAGPSALSLPVIPGQAGLWLPPPAGTIPSPILALPWGDTPYSMETRPVAENHQLDACDQPLVAQNLWTQWATSVGNGDAQATGYTSPVEPSTAGKTTVFRFQQPLTPGSYDRNPDSRVGNGAQIASSTGLQRPTRTAKEVTSKGKGKQKRTPNKSLESQGIDWPATYSKFCAEMDRICVNTPTGEVPDPKAAYAEIRKFVSDDVPHSPLVVKNPGKRLRQDIERYLAGILYELRPRQSGQQRGFQFTLERVEQELAGGLVARDGGTALWEYTFRGLGPNNPEPSRVGVQERNDAIRGCLERMTLFFRRPNPEFVWTRQQVIFYAIAYLLFGAGVFGDGPEAFFTPKPQL